MCVHASDELGGNAGAFERESRALCALEGEAPVVLDRPGGEGACVGVAVKLQHVAEVREGGREIGEELGELRFEIGGRQIEEQIVPALCDLDQDSVLGDLHGHEVGDVLQVRLGCCRGDRGAHRFRVALEHDRLDRWRLVGRVHEAPIAHAGAAFEQRGRAGEDTRAEVVRERLLELLIGLRDEPEHHEEGHHGGDEVGVSYLPRGAVSTGVLRLLLDDDDVGAAGQILTSSSRWRAPLRVPSLRGAHRRRWRAARTRSRAGDCCRAPRREGLP